ncbi:MAG: hypothetical protein WCT20_02245 [Candidatus Babeliales bacterium]
MGKNYQTTVKVIDGSQRLYLKNVPELLHKVDLVNPQCILWYSGQYGLTKRSRDFYENNFITPMVVAFDKQVYGVWLYDLYAWAGLRDASIPLSSAVFKPMYPIIARYKKCTGKASNEFFMALHAANQAEQGLILNILETRHFVWNGSEGFEARGISCYAIDLPPWLGGKFLSKDTMEVYSALQYIESLWLVREIVRKKIISDDAKNPVNVVFLLPGGEESESNYYIDKSNPNEVYAQDIKGLIECDENLKLEHDVEVNVYFYGFNYSPPIEICGILKLKRSHCPWVFFYGDELVSDEAPIIELDSPPILDNSPIIEELLMDPIFIKKINSCE